jgi:hypothetical protein
MHHHIVKASGIFPRRTNVAEGYNRTGKRLAVEIAFLRRVLGVLTCINPPKAERRIPILRSATWRWELYRQHRASSSLGQVQPNSLIFPYRMPTLRGRQEIVPYPRALAGREGEQTVASLLFNCTIWLRGQEFPEQANSDSPRLISGFT